MDSTPSSPSHAALSFNGGSGGAGKEDQKTRTLNLLLSRMKEKLAALQGDYDQQSKKVSEPTQQWPCAASKRHTVCVS